MVFILGVLLILMSVARAMAFYVLMRNKLKFREVYKIITVATTLNKIFFTASGYVIASYFLRKREIPLKKCLSVFVFVEFMSVFLWLVLGVIFGSEIALNMPIIFSIFAGVTLLFLWLKRGSIRKGLAELRQSWECIGTKAILVLPLIILDMIFFIGYYLALFKMFNFSIGILDVFKIVAVSFTVGYLSLAPAGIGFKETGMVLLLADFGIGVEQAVYFACIDRIIMTLFWAALGAGVGFDIIKEHIKRRFMKKTIDT